MAVFSIYTLQNITNFHAIRSWNFHNICNEIGWPRFLRHPVYSRDYCQRVTMLSIFSSTLFLISCDLM